MLAVILWLIKDYSVQEFNKGGFGLLFKEIGKWWEDTGHIIIMTRADIDIVSFRSSSVGRLVQLHIKVQGVLWVLDWRQTNEPSFESALI